MEVRESLQLASEFEVCDTVGTGQSGGPPDNLWRYGPAGTRHTDGPPAPCQERLPLLQLLGSRTTIITCRCCFQGLI